MTQTLFSVVLTAEAAAALDRPRPRAARGRSSQRLQELARDALQEMRSLIFELRPAELEADGLVATLRKHIDVLRRVRTRRRSSCAVDGRAAAAADVEQELFRIAQEALNNALKHAQAPRITSRSTSTRRTCALTVRDDGSGFDPACAGHRGRSGSG